MFDRLQGAYEDFLYYFKVFSIPQRVGAGAAVLFNGSQIIAAWNDITSYLNFGDYRMLCEAANSCSVPIYQLPVRVLILVAIDLLLFKIWSSWVEKFDEAENLDTVEKKQSSSIRGAEELIKWAELLEKGHISQEEFDRKKKEILGN